MKQSLYMELSAVHIEQIKVNTWLLSGQTKVILMMDDFRWSVCVDDREISRWRTLNLALAHGVSIASGQTQV